jgi:flagellar motor switch protein FliN/FliY
MTEKQDPLAQTTLRELAPVYDIPLRITIEVGRLRIRVRDLLRLSIGGVIALKKPAGEPFEISVNDQNVARGEVIMVEQSTGVRIVEITKRAGLL